MENIRGNILRYLKNRRREVEEHILLRRIPKHSRGKLKSILKEMIAKSELSLRVTKNRTLYRLKH